ncbi:MAG: UPF0262 family protein [Myxococcota bacterium]
MTLSQIDIGEPTWSEASEARRHEWRNAIQGMLDEEVLQIRADAHRMTIDATEQALHLTLHDADQAMLDEVHIPHDRLAKHIQEYVDLVRELAKADGSGITRLEALDMAKKVAHDRAADTIERLCAPFKIDHETARRLYTLLLTLRVDTTRLVGLHGHRRVR